jgi:hypothetical protein
MDNTQPKLLHLHFYTADGVEAASTVLKRAAGVVSLELVDAPADEAPVYRFGFPEGPLRPLNDLSPFLSRQFNDAPPEHGIDYDKFNVEISFGERATRDAQVNAAVALAQVLVDTGGPVLLAELDPDVGDIVLYDHK